LEGQYRKRNGEHESCKNANYNAFEHDPLQTKGLVRTLSKTEKESHRGNVLGIAGSSCLLNVKPESISTPVCPLPFLALDTHLVTTQRNPAVGFLLEKSGSVLAGNIFPAKDVKGLNHMRESRDAIAVYL
jgi:hypothetical protein